MIKHTTFVRFDPGPGSDEASARWREELGPLLLEIPDVVRCVQNRVVLTTTNDGVVEDAAGFHGFMSLWWQDEADFETALGSPEWAKAEEYGRQIFDDEWAERGMSAQIEERVKRVGLGAEDDGVSTPPGDPIKLIGFLQYRDDMDRDEANRYWTTHHGQLALRIAEMGHYVQNHVIRAVGGAASGARGFDGYSEAWFADLATYERAMASEPWQTLVDDGPELFDMDVFLGGIVREEVLRG
jgi:EthD domain